MQTKSLLAMTLLLVGTQHLTACTIVTASDDADEGDAATSNDDTTSDETTDKGDSGESEVDGGVTTSDDDTTSDNHTADDTDATNSEDGGTETSTDDTNGEDDSDASEGDAGDETTTDPNQGDDAGSVGGNVYKNGSVNLQQSVTTVSSVSIVTSSASASFGISTFGSTGEQPLVDLPCETKTVGACTLSECEFGDDSEPQPEDPEYSFEQVSAGSIKITGTTADLTLTAGNDKTYTPVTATERWWEGGETLVVQAPGSDDVPAFELELAAPSAVELTAPELSLLQPVSASRAEDFEILWDNGAEGTVSITIADADSEPVARSISCTVDADSGGITVDASLLENFSDEALVSVTVGNTTTKTVEGWALAFTASSSAGSGMVEFED